MMEFMAAAFKGAASGVTDQECGAAKARLKMQIATASCNRRSLQLAVMADTAGQCTIALIGCYGQHRRPVARSNWLLWPTPQGQWHALIGCHGQHRRPNRTLSLETSRPRCCQRDS